MSFNIGTVSKTGKTNIELQFDKKTTESSAAVEIKKLATKTYLTSSTSQNVGVQDPYQELSDFMKMRDAQRMQYLWLKKHGISHEEFDAMSGEDKQPFKKSSRAFS